MTRIPKRKIGIKRKIILIVCLSNLIIMTIGIGLGYFLGFRLVRDIIGKEYEKMARLLGSYVASQINGESEDVRTYATRPLWVDAVKEANKRYERMDEQSRRQHLVGMDKRWSEAGKDDTLIKEYLQNRVSRGMQDIITVRRNVKEIFITDKFGGVVAASGKTGAFYQADEEWWQKAYGARREGVFIGEIELDGSSQPRFLTMAVPIIDDDGSVIGVCKQIISVERLFGHLEEFKIGKTGRASVINEDGKILYQAGILPAGAEFCDKEDFEKILKDKNRYCIRRLPQPYKKKIFSAFARMPPLFLPDRGRQWIVVISQEAGEVFAPLNMMFIQLGVVVSLLVVMLWPVGYVFGRIFVKPIHELHVATEEIMAGNWDYPLKIESGDEIEQFADAFRKMIADIKTKQEELVRAKAELEELSRGLEEKVKERTGELETALKVKSEFTSTVSHELRTPLASIKEGIAMVLDGTIGPLKEEQAKFLDIAKRNADRLARLINDILDFQKLEAGKIMFRMEEGDINEVVTEAAATMAMAAENKGLEFILDLDDGLPKAKFDKDRILQVLINLIGNAIKFTESGEVAVSTRQKDGFIQVSVEDTGIGIMEKDMSKLFQQFEQIGKGLDRRTGGTGLGLAISKEIIEGHDGKIWAESTFGKGSTFYFLVLSAAGTR